jgi:hypothetical protein
VRVVMLFEADPEMPDPERGHPNGALTYEHLSENSDCFVVWREWGEQFEDGYRDHIIGQGIWEHLTDEQINDALAAIEAPA